MVPISSDLGTVVVDTFHPVGGWSSGPGLGGERKGMLIFPVGGELRKGGGEGVTSRLTNPSPRWEAEGTM